MLRVLVLASCGGECGLQERIEMGERTECEMCVDWVFWRGGMV